MKYKVGDKVRIKSLDWYNENKNEDGSVWLMATTHSKYNFMEPQSDFCGKVVTIEEVYRNFYTITDHETDFYWTDEMIEGLVEEDNNGAGCPNYDIIDKRKTIRITEKDYQEKVEIYLGGYELKQEGEKWFAVKKKPKYPQTYEECCKIMGINHTNDLDICEHCDYKTEITYYEDSLLEKIEALYRLIICRDAYWKLAGEEMGLGKPWEPDWTKADERKYCIVNTEGNITKWVQKTTNKILAFPTEEMRDAFYENFEELIESVKELL